MHKGEGGVLGTAADVAQVDAVLLEVTAQQPPEPVGGEPAEKACGGSQPCQPHGDVVWGAARPWHIALLPPAPLRDHVNQRLAADDDHRSSTSRQVSVCFLLH